MNDIRQRNIRLIGVSMDTIEDQLKFSKDRGAYFNLLCDTKGEALKAFGVPLDWRGRPNRETFLLLNGQVVWHDDKAATKRIAKDIIEAVDGYSAAP